MPPVTLQEHIAKLSVNRDRIKAIKDLVEKEKRALSKEERDELTALLAECDQLKAAKAELEAEQALLTRSGSMLAELAVGTGRQTPTQSLSALLPEDDDKPANGQDPKSFLEVPNGRINGIVKEGFKSLGEQLQAIAMADITNGSRVDPRLTWHTLAPTGMGKLVPADGGYLVQKDFVNSLVQRMYETGQVINRVRKLPISANSDGIKVNLINETSRATGSRWGGVQVYWIAEADTKTASKPSFRQSTLELKELAGLCYVTNALLKDSVALESIIRDAFSEEIAFMVEDAIIEGTGAGMPLGILNSGAVVTVDGETNQPSATIQYENIVKMWSRMWARSRRNAVWLINQDAEPSLFGMQLVTGSTGFPVYMPPGGLSTSPYGTLFGRPVIPVEYASTVGTVGDIMLFDFSQYLMIEKEGLEADESIHVRFINNEHTFRFVYRTDGQPMWNSPLTPFKGTNTLSPFVVLGTRSG